MGTAITGGTSLWWDNEAQMRYPMLHGGITADVAVIGAGITGLTTALLLKQAGLRVAVIEADRVCSGVTGYTTAKLTALHGLIYDTIESKFDAAAARIYGAANQAAIEQAARFIDAYDIDCHFERRPAYTYTTDPQCVEKVQKEVAAAQKAGLPVEFTEALDLPFEILAAIRMDNQAQFDPVRYGQGLARAIDGDGSHIFESTRVLDVESGAPGVVKTRNGDVQAEHVVLATHLPFLDRGGFFARTSPQRSYLLAVRLADAAQLPHGMYLSADQPTRSLRVAHAGQYLLVGGEGHKVGQDPDTRRHYAALETWAREQFDVVSVDYRWSAQDYMPVDQLPYIGQILPGSHRLWVATGYAKWGMSLGTVAGMILCDRIQQQDNPWAELFNATRVDLLQSARKLVGENLNVAKRFVGDRFDTANAPDLAALAPGEGQIVQCQGEAVAAYRDETGAVHAVSPVCTHLGCYVQWNTAERSWDCPCHGSRYAVDGRVIHGPALHDLEQKKVTEPDEAVREQ